MHDIIFISVTEALAMHEAQINAFGGLHGIRDIGLLDAAMGSPQVSFGGSYLLKDVYEMAAAYLYNLIKNHPFLDGNKRTGVVVCLTFLFSNGIAIKATQEDIFDLAVNIASSKISRDQIADILRSLHKPKKST